MFWNFEKMYTAFQMNNHQLLLDGKWGVERELQRVNDEGGLALTPHPAAFGDKLTNKEITTDFAESQMELITPAFSTVEEVDSYLRYLYEKAKEGVGNELLWPFSMPPLLPEEDLIPIASFSDSPEGRAAYRYRQGLANRYGKKMQMISGIHFNFSFGEALLDYLYLIFGKGRGKKEFIDELYFSVARNFLRYRWLIVYLFGASPSFDESYDTVLKEEIENVRKCCPECCCNYEGYATSLRVSRYGYANTYRSDNYKLFNSKEEYVQGIRTLMSKKSKKFAKVDIQLNDKILQKDSEFYSPIRLKQLTEPGESQIDAIERRGVRYTEVRILDINPYEKTGISLSQMYFLQVFLLFCLFEDNSYIDSKEMNNLDKNHNTVALKGRLPELMLYQPKGGEVSLREWGESIFERLSMIAELIDKGKKDVYSLSVHTQHQKLTDISLLVSAKLQQEMKLRNESFLELGLHIAKNYKNEY